MSPSQRVSTLVGISLISLWVIVGFVTVDAQPESNKGLYILHFMNISADRTSAVRQQIFFSSFKDTKIRVDVPALNQIEIVDLDSSNSYQDVKTFSYDLGTVVGVGQTSEQTAALVVSENGAPIWLQTNKVEQGTSAAYLALPVTQHATEFFIPSYGVSTSFHTGFAVAGLEDGTCLEVYRVDGNSYTRLGLFHLDRLFVFSALDNTFGNDYTGIFVNSTRPLAVFGGHECARVPENVAFCDAIVEQIPPVIEWDKEFLVGPIAGRNEDSAGYEFRVIASDNDTEVRYTRSTDPSTTITEYIDRGHFLSVNTTSSLANVHVVCSKKCLVAQYNFGQEKVANETIKTDPFMMIVPPITHYDSNMKFSTMQHIETRASQVLLTNSLDYLTIIAPTATRGQIRLDGGLPSGTWTPAVSPDYSIMTVTLTVKGFHTLSHIGITDKYMGFAYGHGVLDHTGYGYMTGYLITDDAISDSSLYNIIIPTTEEPVTTREPWVIGNWTDDFSADELPMYGLRFTGTFSVVDRDDKIIEKVCSEGFKTFTNDKRLPAMGQYLTDQIDSICPGLQGSQLDLKIACDQCFYTEYTHGNFSFLVILVGSPSSTFRQVEQCASNLKIHVNALGNWPAVSSKIPDQELQANNPTTTLNFMSRDGDSMADCDKVNLVLAGTSEAFTEDKRAWICNGLDPEEILNIIGGTNMISACMTRVCTMLIIIMLFTQWLS